MLRKFSRGYSTEGGPWGAGQVVPRGGCDREGRGLEQLQHIHLVCLKQESILGETEEVEMDKLKSSQIMGSFECTHGDSCSGVPTMKSISSNKTMMIKVCILVA